MKKKAFQVAHSKVKFDSVPNKPTKKSTQKEYEKSLFLQPLKYKCLFPSKTFNWTSEPTFLQRGCKDVHCGTSLPERILIAQNLNCSYGFKVQTDL